MQQLETAVGRSMTLKDSDSATTIDIPLTSARVLDYLHLMVQVTP